MATAANIAVSVTARTGKFEKGMRRSRRSVKSFSSSVGRAQKQLARFAIGFLGPLGAVAGIIKFTKAVENFDRAMLNSLAIMGDVSTRMREDMADAAIAVARVTKFSSEEVAKSYFFLASAGLDAAQSIKALPLVAKFAQAGMFDMALATDLLTDAQSALGLTVADTTQNLANMKRISDVLVKANTMANASVQQFAEALTNKAAAAMKMFNIPLEQGIGLLAAFADQGVKGAEGGTAFNIVLRDLTTKVLENAKAFERAGIAIFNSQGGMRDLSDIVRGLETRLAGMTTEGKKLELMTLGFPAKSVSFVQMVVGMADAMARYTEEAKNAADFTAKVAGKQLTPLTKAYADLEGALMGAKGAGTEWNKLWARMVRGAARDLEWLKGAGGGFARFTGELDEIVTDAQWKKILASRGIGLAPPEPIVSAEVRAAQNIADIKKKAADDLLVKQEKFAKQLRLSVRTDAERFTALVAELRAALRALPPETFPLETFTRRLKELQEAFVPTPIADAFVTQVTKERELAANLFAKSLTPFQSLQKQIQEIMSVARFLPQTAIDRLIGKAKTDYMGGAAVSRGRPGLRSVAELGGGAGLRAVLANQAGRTQNQLLVIAKATLAIQQRIERNQRTGGTLNP